MLDLCDYVCHENQRTTHVLVYVHACIGVFSNLIECFLQND